MPDERPYLRGLLLRRVSWMESRVLAAAEVHGYGAVTPAMNRLFGHMRRRPVSLSTLARQLGVSRQAVHQVVKEAEALGLVELTAHGSDARAKEVGFTAAGWAMSASAAASLDAIEEDLAGRIGRDDLETLRRILAKAWSEPDT